MVPVPAKSRKDTQPQEMMYGCLGDCKGEETRRRKYREITAEKLDTRQQSVAVFERTTFLRLAGQALILYVKYSNTPLFVKQDNCAIFICCNRQWCTSNILCYIRCCYSGDVHHGGMMIVCLLIS